MAELTNDGHQIIAQDAVAFVNVFVDGDVQKAVYCNVSGSLEVSTYFESGHACGTIEWTESAH